MWEDQAAWLLEFRHDYGERCRVIKRLVEAAPMVIRKYDLEPGTAIAFTVWEGGGRAMTTFHFHPDFPMDGRRAYMVDHDEGGSLAARMLDGLRAERRRRWRNWVGLSGRMARAAASAVHAAGVFALFHSPTAR